MNAFFKGLFFHWFPESLPGKAGSSESEHLCNLENHIKLTVTQVGIVCHFPGGGSLVPYLTFILTDCEEKPWKSSTFGQ